MDRPISRRMFDAVDRLGAISPQWSDERVQRARLLVGMCLLAFVLMPILMATGVVLGASSRALMSTIGVIGVHLLALMLLRRGHETVPAFIVCIGVNALQVMVGIHHDGLGFTLHPISLVSPALAMYLLGSRVGIAFTGVVVAEIVAGYSLHASGHALETSFFPTQILPVLAQVAVQAALVIGGLGWLHSKAHERAHVALAGAVGTLRESEASLVSLIDNTNDMVALIDPTFHFVRTNASLRSFMLRHTGNLIAAGDGFFETVRPARLELWHDRIERALRGEQVLCDEVFDTAQGPSFVEFTVAAVPGPDGRPNGLTLFGRDVTMRKAAEAKLLEAETQLRHAQKIQAIGTLSGGIAHEINNPLSSILANLACLDEELRRLNGPLTPEGLAELLAYREDATMGAKRIMRIVNDVRSFSHTDDERLEPVDVGLAVRQAIELAAEEVDAQTKVILDLSQGALVMADESRLRQVLLNLIVNASESLPPDARGNRLQVATRLTGDGRIAVEVQDNGAGMVPAVLERAFEPFFTTKPIGKGTGLGLSICHGIVTRMGGAIEIESEPGKGTTVRLLLVPVNIPVHGGDDEGAHRRGVRHPRPV